MLGRRETLRANSRRAVILRLCTSLGSRRRAGRRCLEAAPPARAPSATVSPAGERTQWCKRVCLGMRPGPGPRLAQRAKPNTAARTVGDASGPPAVAVPNTAPTRGNCKAPPTPGRRRALCPQGSSPGPPPSDPTNATSLWIMSGPIHTTLAPHTMASTASQHPSGLAVDQVVHHHHVDRAARADVLDVGAQRAGAERNPNPGDDRVGEGDPNEGKPAFIGPNRRAVTAH